MTTLTPRIQFLLVGIVVATLALAGWFFLVTPKRTAAADLERDLEALRAAQPVEPQPQAGDQLVEMFLLAKAMPDRIDMPGVLLDLEQLAGSSGLKLVSVAPQAPVAGAGFETLPLQAVVEGRYTSVSRFLRRLRNRVALRGGRVELDGRLYTVAKLDVTTGAGGATLQATMMLNAYRFGAASGSAPGAAAPTAYSDAAPSP